MRILKHSGTLEHDELLREVVARLRGYFEPPVSMIKVLAPNIHARHLYGRTQRVGMHGEHYFIGLLVIKLLENVFQLFLVLFHLLKVYQNQSTGKL